jgi:hypothetical protein
VGFTTAAAAATSERSCTGEAVSEFGITVARTLFASLYGLKTILGILHVTLADFCVGCIEVAERCLCTRLSLVPLHRSLMSHLTVWAPTEPPQHLPSASAAICSSQAWLCTGDQRSDAALQRVSCNSFTRISDSQALPV